MNSVSRNLGLWLLLVIVSLVLWSVLSTQRARELEEVSYSDFVASVEQGKVDEVTIQGQGIRGQYRADEGEEPLHFKSYAPEDSDLVPLLRQHDVRIRARPSDDEPWYVIVLVQWAPGPMHTDDATEVDDGTDPTDPDTDHDGLDDGDVSDPLHDAGDDGTDSSHQGRDDSPDHQEDDGSDDAQHD